MLQDFEDGWHALPQSARRKWSAKENFPINPYTTSPEGFYNWSSAFRTMWSRLLEDKQRELSRCRFAWKTYYGQLNAWKFPDIEGEDSMNNLTDTSLMLEGWFIMKEFYAVQEFDRRLREDKVGLWRETLNF